MKKSGCCLIFLLFIATGLSADIYIKEITHTDSYYYGGVVEPADESTSELWFDKNRLAYVTAGRMVIIDASTGLISIVNRNNKTYIQTELPLELKKIVPPQIYPMLEPRQMTGQVTETAEKKTFDNWKCVGYDIQVDQPYGLEIKTWCTLDVPFDWKELRILFNNIKKLANYSQRYIEEEEKMKGFPVSTHVTIFLQGTTFSQERRVVEISEKESAPDTYAIPPDFQKNDLLSIEDLRNR